MTIPPRKKRSATALHESSDSLRKRLAAFGAATRETALRRHRLEEPIAPGPVLSGRRVRAKTDV